MRIIAAISILCLLLSGYASAANAFGLVSSCPKEMMAAQGMKDCCDKEGKEKPANCMSCQCCTAAVYPTGLTTPPFEIFAHDASGKFYAPDQVVIKDFNYLPLRPPKTFA